MLNEGFDMKNDPFFEGVIKKLKHRAYVLLRKKSNILVKDAARLIGVLDEYGVLDENEVFV